MTSLRVIDKRIMASVMAFTLICHIYLSLKNPTRIRWEKNVSRWHPLNSLNILYILLNGVYVRTNSGMHVTNFIYNLHSKILCSFHHRATSVHWIGLLLSSLTPDLILGDPVTRAWADGSNSTFRYWDIGDPGTGHCVRVASMANGRSMEDASCTVYRTYTCQVKALGKQQHQQKQLR